MPAGEVPHGRTHALLSRADGILDQSIVSRPSCAARGAVAQAAARRTRSAMARHGSLDALESALALETPNERQHSGEEVGKCPVFNPISFGTGPNMSFTDVGERNSACPQMAGQRCYVGRSVALIA